MGDSRTITTKKGKYARVHGDYAFSGPALSVNFYRPSAAQLRKPLQSSAWIHVGQLERRTKEAPFGVEPNGASWLPLPDTLNAG